MEKLPEIVLSSIMGIVVTLMRLAFREGGILKFKEPEVWESLESSVLAGRSGRVSSGFEKYKAIGGGSWSRV